MPLSVETRQIDVLVQKRFFDHSDTLDKTSIEENVALDDLQAVSAARPNRCILKVDMRISADRSRDSGETTTYRDQSGFRPGYVAIGMQSSVEIRRGTRLCVEQLALIQPFSSA